MDQALSAQQLEEVGRAKSDAQPKPLIVLRYCGQGALIESQRGELGQALGDAPPPLSSRARARARVPGGAGARAHVGRGPHRHALRFGALCSVGGRTGKNRETKFMQPGVGE